MSVNPQLINRIHEKIYKRTLPSGMQCYIIPKKEYEEKEAMIGVNFGSCDILFQTDQKHEMPKGIAHFLEHKMFEEEWGNVFELFAKTGAHVNAFTNFTATAYYFTCTESFEKNIETLLSFVQSPYFTDETVENEKGIIAQEIEMYQDDPQWRIFLQLLEGLYLNHPVRYNIAGSVASIHETTKEMLYCCHEAFYRPENMTLILVGGFSEADLLHKVEEMVQAKPPLKVERLGFSEPDAICRNQLRLSMPVAQNMFQIGCKDIQVPMQGKALCKKTLAVKMGLDILFGESSAFFDGLYQKGLVDEDFFYQYINGGHFGYSVISGASEKPEDVMAFLMEEVRRLKREKISGERFEIIKNKHIGRFLRGLNSIDTIAQTQLDLSFKGIELSDCLESYNELKPSDVQQELEKLMAEERMVLSVIEPK